MLLRWACNGREHCDGLEAGAVGAAAVRLGPGWLKVAHAAAETTWCESVGETCHMQSRGSMGETAQLQASCFDFGPSSGADLGPESLTAAVCPRLELLLWAGARAAA